MKYFRIFVAAVLAFTVMCFSGCSDKTEESFVITLYPEYAPITVENFVNLVEEGFYDGFTFHRIVEGFVAQGGDPNGDGTGGSDETIKGEFIDNGVTTNTMSHQRGVVSMARNSTSYDSASSQFFICYDDCSSTLDGQYAAFGKIDEEGMEVVDKFLDIEREYSSSGELSVPTTPITIEKAEVISDSSDGHQRVKMTVSF